MTKEELREYLAENLRIDIRIHERQEFNKDNLSYRVEVKLLLENEEIDSSEDFIN